MPVVEDARCIFDHFIKEENPKLIDISYLELILLGGGVFDTHCQHVCFNIGFNYTNVA